LTRNARADKYEPRTTPRAREQPAVKFFTVFSTVEQNLAAKVRNSARRAANMGLSKYLASATLRDTVKTSAKPVGRIMSPLL